MQEIVDIVSMHDATKDNPSNYSNVRRLYDERVKRLKRNWRRKIRKANRQKDKGNGSNAPSGFLMHKLRETLMKSQKRKFDSAVNDLKNLKGLNGNLIVNHTIGEIEKKDNQKKDKAIKIEEFDTLASYDFKVSLITKNK